MQLLPGNSTTKSLDIMQRAMDYAMVRDEVLKNNIANATTPNYKRRDVTFQMELLRAVNSEKKQDIPFKMSREKHIPAYRPKDYREVEPKIITEYNTYEMNNGNSVNIEQEMMESTKNTMYYNALAQRMTKEFTKLKFILRST